MLRTRIGSLALSSCIYNACCPSAMTVEDLEAIGASESAAILTKTVTLGEHAGNPRPRSIKTIDLGGNFCVGSFNSEGLPSPGISYCKFGEGFYISLIIISC
jgi:dihydroorotate dehydrogenase (fumarate)